MDFGIHFGIIFASFWYHFSIFFRYPVLDGFWDAIFSIFGRKWSPNWDHRDHRTAHFGAQDRSKNAYATQPRYFIDLGARFDDILKVLASKIKQLGPHGRTNSVLFSADVAEACRFLASHLLASSGRCPWGAAVSLCVYNPPRPKALGV